MEVEIAKERERTKADRLAVITFRAAGLRHEERVHRTRRKDFSNTDMGKREKETERKRKRKRKRKIEKGRGKRMETVEFFKETEME